MNESIREILLMAGFLPLLASLGLGMLRLYMGPHLAERGVAIGKISLIVVAILAGMAMALQDALHLELAFILTLVGFLSAVTIARFLIHTKSK